MAEEKKTVKKKKSEEVVVEKRFCPDCGKELKEKEECSCKDTSSEAISINTDQVIKIFKGLWNTIINCFKKPYDTIKEEVNKENTKTNMLMLVLIVLSVSLCFIASISAMLGALLDIKNYIDIPYFKFFIYAFIFEFVLAFVPISATYIIAKITGNKNFNYKKSIGLYTTSMAPTILANLVMALFYFLNLIPIVGLLIGAVIGIIAFFNYIIVYIDLIKAEDNKKSYLITGMLVIWIIGAVIVLSIFTSSLRSTIGNQIGNGLNNSYNMNDLWK